MFCIFVVEILVLIIFVDGFESEMIVKVGNDFIEATHRYMGMIPSLRLIVFRLALYLRMGKNIYNKRLVAYMGSWVTENGCTVYGVYIWVHGRKKGDTLTRFSLAR